MFRNYLILALRHFSRNKIFTLINTLGLALGMACCFLIIRFIAHEFSYDQFHEHQDRIHRINYHAGFGNSDVTLARIPPPISPLLADYFPEVEHTARLFARDMSVKIKGENNRILNNFEVENLYFADSTVLDIFTFNFLSGNPNTALDAPYSLILTEEMATQFFGTSEALGRTVYFMDVYPFEVTGVVEAFPSNSHLEFNMLVPYQNMFDIAPENSRQNMRSNLSKNWVISHSYTYVLLREGASADRVNEGLRVFLDQYGNEQVKDQQTFSLVPLLDIHLNSIAALEPTPTANLNYLYIFLAIGILTLLIACINFINFSTAGSLARAREVGVRKVLGAGKETLIGQFIGESMLLSFIAFLIAIGLVFLFLPYLNDLTDRQMHFHLLKDWKLLALFFLLFPAVGFLAGTYPAFFVTRFKPVSVLKGKGYHTVPKGAVLRKVLIMVQFAASIILIIGTLGIVRQLQFLRDQPLGFQTEYVIDVPLFSPSINNIFGGVDGALRQKMNAFEEELLANPNIEGITLSSGTPGFGGVRRNVSTDKISKEDNLFIAGIAVDYDFVETYGLELVAGRDFDQAFGTDHQDAFMINEQAVELLQMESPEAAIGQPINREGKQGQVVGVVKDFHFGSLRQEIDAFLMDVNVGLFTSFSIRIKSQQMPATLSFIESKWNGFFPQKVFEYTFLNESISEMYNQEGRLAQMIGYFAFLAILISCFGLYGLVAYAAAQKTKEIGIRKVLGASVAHILALLSKEFFYLILLAGLVAIPMSYYGLNIWLQDYPFRIGLSVWLFLLPLLAVLFMAFLTTSYRTIKAAKSDPSDILRYE